MVPYSSSSFFSPKLPSCLLPSLFPIILLLPTPIAAHGGHDKVPEGEATSPDPLDRILWTHILLMVLSFGLIFPTGMVLGIVRSRWHVPLQILGVCIAIPAYFMGHMHKGRQFAKPHIHASFANSLVLMTIVQVGIGIGLKLHLEERKGWIGRVFGSSTGRGGRRIVVIAHGWIGKLMPVVSWTQMLFGGIVALGFCRADHLGQCLAHFIMGSAFIGYGIVMTILLLVGQGWLRRTGRSQEFFDSIAIAVWGCVNTFTEHRWGQPWAKNDLQHTSMGIVWWCAGLLGIWLSRSRSGRPRRNILPGIVIMLTGWAMSSHPQDIPLSTMVHTVFGWTLTAAGAARIVEICFLLKDSRGNTEPSSWQHLTPFLLYASGLLFLSATEQQMVLLASHSVSHVSYILIIYSGAFLLYLFVNILLHIYAQAVWPGDDSNGLRASTTNLNPNNNGGSGMRGGNRNFSVAATINESARVGPSGERSTGWHSRKPSTASHVAFLNGSATHPQPRLPRHNATASQHVRDAEEFELEGLMSEGEDDNNDMDSPLDSGNGTKKERIGLDTPV